MAEKQTPPSRRGDSDRDRRQTASRRIEEDGDRERRQTRRTETDTSGRERRQSPDKRSGERRPARRTDPDSSTIERRQTSGSARRTDVIRCENCGEDYSITYKRCPFCDERPGRGGVIGGKRVANARGGGYGRPVNPIQVAGLIISLVLIISALFIVFRFVGAPLLSGGKSSGSGSSQGGSDVSQSTGGSQSQPGGTSQQPGGSTSQPGGSSSQPGGSSSQSGPGTQDPQPPVSTTVQSISLSKSDITLKANEKTTLVATLSPRGAAGDVVWSSSNTSIATVDANGQVVNVNAGTQKVSVTITAACGDKKAECIVRCNPKNGTADPGTTDPNGGGTTVTVPAGSTGTVKADNGLRVRSGPGTNYDRIGSLDNGTTVSIQGEENGWYKISYKNGVGYVSKEYVTVS